MLTNNKNRNGGKMKDQNYQSFEAFLGEHRLVKDSQLAYATDSQI
jgi:hypothetical protein